MSSGVGFELDEGEVVVRTPGSGFARVEVPAGIRPATFRNALATVDILWRENGEFPTVTDLEERWPQIPRRTWARLMLDDAFLDALEKRGIRVPGDAGLTEQQNLALLALATTGDRRSEAAKLKEIGIPWSQYTAWMKDPLFSAARMKLAKNAFEAAKPMLVQRVITEAESGKVDALKLGLEMAGIYSPNEKQARDFERLTMILVESIIKHTTPEVRDAILSDMRAAGAMIDVSTPRALEA